MPDQFAVLPQRPEITFHPDSSAQRTTAELMAECIRRGQEIHRLRTALAEYADHNRWNRLAVFEFNCSPGWTIAEKALAK